MSKKKQRLFKVIQVFLIFNLLLSCNTAKYTYTFNEGKNLDFTKGKWLLNNAISNSKVFNVELYSQTRDQFKEILGPSLLEINDVRQSRIIKPEIPFNLNKEELIQLYTDSGCDFLINIKGNIISDNAGSLSLSSNDPNYYASNEASVTIKIYDLKNGEILSYSIVYGKLVDEGSHFESKNKFPMLLASSHNIMLKGAKKLIDKYEKNKL